METKTKNVFGIVRYSVENNGSQEKIMEKAGIANIITIVKSGYKSNYTITKVKELLKSFFNVCIVVCELDRLTRIPEDFEDLITFLEENSLSLTIWELSTNKKFEVSRDVYETSIKKEIYKGYIESKAKSDRGKNRSSNDTYCLKNLKQSIAFGCLRGDVPVSSAETSRILKKLGFNTSASSISNWRKKYEETSYCYWVNIPGTSLNLRVPDYETLINDCENDIERIKLQTEFENIENVVIDEYNNVGLNPAVLELLCKDQNAQNIVFKTSKEIEELEYKMKKVCITKDITQKDLADYLKEDLDKEIITQEQYIIFISKIGIDDVQKIDLIHYVYSLKSNGTIDFETYQSFTSQL